MTCGEKKRSHPLEPPERQGWDRKPEPQPPRSVPDSQDREARLHQLQTQWRQAAEAPLVGAGHPEGEDLPSHLTPTPALNISHRQRVTARDTGKHLHVQQSPDRTIPRNWK